MSAVIERKPDLPMEVDPFLSMIERVAANKDVDVGKLERLLAMQERVMAKQAETAFNSALARMQAELPTINEKGIIAIPGRAAQRYAKFEDINEAVKPVLQKHGFAVTFKVSTEQNVKVVGILVHKEGHREQTEIALPTDTSGSKNAVQ